MTGVLELKLASRLSPNTHQPSGKGQAGPLCTGLCLNSRFSRDAGGACITVSWLLVELLKTEKCNPIFGLNFVGPVKL